MKVAVLTTLFVAACLTASTQPRTIQDYISHCVPVRSFEHDRCASAVIVKSAAEFQVGDRVCIVQMQGMVRSTDPSDSGSFQTPGPAGNFELATVAAISGNTLLLNGRLRRDYDIESRVQVVKVLFADVLVLQGNISSPEWDGEKGGVVVIEARDSMFLDGNIDMREKGFRPGVRSEFFQSCGLAWNLNAPFPSDMYGQKGEGATVVPKDQQSGIGRATTGGGGGGNHNAGGGGGGNAGGGGVGGASYTVCGVIKNGGRGGDGYQQESLLPRLFLGGGGGGGHENESRGSDGARGGGMVLLITPVFDCTPSAGLNLSGGTAQSGYQDGTGGGGAGGSLYLSIDQYRNYPIVDLRGGGGGTANTVTGKHGTGGGGGGGHLLVKTPSYMGATTLKMGGGLAGVINGGRDGTWYASDGESGHITYDAILPRVGESGSGNRSLLAEAIPYGHALFKRDTLSLTRLEGFSTGAAYVKKPIDISIPFEMNLTFRLNDGNDKDLKDGGPQGADGFAVLFQPAPVLRVGEAGGGIGYRGLSNCVVVEVDAYLNAHYSDPSASHVAVQAARGSIEPAHVAPYVQGITTNVPPLVADGSLYYLRLRSSGTSLEISLSKNAQNNIPCLTIPGFTFSEKLDFNPSGAAYVGITSATGQSIQAHEILTWTIDQCGADSILSTTDWSTEESYPTIRPAPSSEFATLQWSGDSDAAISIHDVTGRMLWSKSIIGGETNRACELPASEFASGVYYVSVRCANRIAMVPWHVQR